MKKNRVIFYIVFGLFHLFVLFFTIYIDSNKSDFSFLSTILKWMSVLKYGAFLGLILLITDVIWATINTRESEKEKAVLTHEINTLKAKLFDLQEAAKEGVSRPANPNVKS